MRYRDIKTAAILAGGFSVPVVAGLGVWYYGEHVRSLWLSFSSFCQQSLQLWLTVLGRDGNIAILGSWILLATGLVWGGTALLRSALLLKRSRRSLLQRTTSLANLSDPDVLVVQDERVWAMTVGLFRPRVYVSSKLAKVFSQEEFDAVIAHEKEHMKNLHPLSAFIAYVAARFLFYLPISRELLSRLELRHELRADQAAIKKSSQAALGSAILKMHHRGAGLDMAGASGFAHLQQRVAMLVGDKQASKPSSWLARVVTVGAITLVLSAFLPAGQKTAEAGEYFIGGMTVEQGGGSCLELRLSPYEETQSHLLMSLRSR